MSFRKPSGTIGNALSLFATTVVTSASGFLFWVLAAHALSQSAVGSSSAVLSAMQLLATIAMFGLGTLLIGELARRDERSKELLSTAWMVAGAIGISSGAVFAVLARLAAPNAFGLFSDVGNVVLFSTTVGLTTALLVIDSATIGLSRASWQFWRNTAYSILKLAMLPIAALIWGRDEASVPLAVWFAGTALSVPLLAVLSRGSGIRWFARPNWRLVRSYGGKAFGHHWLNVSIIAPRYLLPVFVAALLSPSLNASFYAALLMVGFAYVVPSHLSTALFGIASGRRSALKRELRRTLVVSTGVAILSGLVFGFLAPTLLNFFGSDYRSAATALAILGLGTFPIAVKSHYMAVCRVNGDLGRCAAVVMVASLVEVTAPVVALLLGGKLNAVSSAWVGTLWLEALLFWPVVAAAAAIPGTMRLSHSNFVAGLAPRTMVEPASVNSPSHVMSTLGVET